MFLKNRGARTQIRLALRNKLRRFYEHVLELTRQPAECRFLRPYLGQPAAERTKVREQGGK